MNIPTVVYCAYFHTVLMSVTEIISPTKLCSISSYATMRRRSAHIFNLALLSEGKYEIIKKYDEALLPAVWT